MRKMLSAVLTGMLLVLLAGCQSETETITSSAIQVHKNGTMTGIIVEPFAEEFYDIDELQDMARLEIAQYNDQAVDERIKLESVELLENNVKAVIDYDSAEDYAAFNEVICFYGTVEEAKKAGFLLGADVTDEMLENHIVIFEEPIGIMTPTKILAYSDNLVVTQNKKLMMAQTDAVMQHYVVFK